ncbi:MAG: hypothetical protein BGO50_01805 [Rhodanobacter sp. 67-28]|nr:MAG: hypothetical protein BGO50_01805 [Rhodanobacter sp. 67-28]
MAETTEIAWCDSTFNPWMGCTAVSSACDHCYASVSTPVRRFGVLWGHGQARHRTSNANWELPRRWNALPFATCTTHGWRGERRALSTPDCPGRNGQADACVIVEARRRVFCASLADVFDNEVDPQWRADLLDLIDRTRNLDWLLLTKRIGNVIPMLTAHRASAPDAERSHFLTEWLDGCPPAHVWLGATVCNQTEADRDIPKLLAVPAAVRFLSIEPMLGAVDIRRWMGESIGASRHRLQGEGFYRCDVTGAPLEGIDWVIVGGESGHGARPMHPAWPRSLRDQCAAAGVPYLFKQWGNWKVESSALSDRDLPSPADAKRAWLGVSGQMNAPSVDDTADGCTMVNVGKRVSGRQLDGHTHDGFPVINPRSNHQAELRT